MPITLSLLETVRWDGEPVLGERPQALLAALAAAGRTVGSARLVDLIWESDVPANPLKALQVLVSRTRAAHGPDSVVRDGDGYRLGVDRARVDTQVLADRAAAARSAFDSDPARAAELAAEAVALGTVAAGDGHGPLGSLRRQAERDLEQVRLLLARAEARLGAYAEALPVLAKAWAANPADEALLSDLLRSEAAVRGTGAALSRYEAYRADLRDRIGADPGPDLQRIHRELLVQDSPVRAGVHYEATTLLGRAADIRRLHALLAASRVVSIVGPGGLGKTRLAHVLGREHPAPVVHFVELVGVTAPDDLVGEIGSALGVRDSVSGRRTLTPEQRADVRARIARYLDQAPSLLILDNCEHIVAAVADLVAYLTATTRELRVLTTTRAPLAIAAEQVYLLAELDTENAAELFRQRARAARPDVHLAGTDQVVAEIVERLDGLPLAIELAAAKVRVMAVADIARRLENRFALLRGGDRSAPDRHQTLLAVIDWSWNLLAERERRALRWLSVFHDGFTLAAAEAMLGDDALAAVQDLADQSLLTVVETGPGGVRYRMLETVREFGRMQLVDAGEDDAAEQAQRAWAVGFSVRHARALFSPRQFDVVDAIRPEETNLSDVLRRTLVASDPAATMQILAALAGYWIILGEHPRLLVLIEAAANAVDGWTPPAELADATRMAIGMTLNGSLVANSPHSDLLRAALRKLGPGEHDPWIAAMVTMLTDIDPRSADGFLQQLRAHAASPDREIAALALPWLSQALENMGDPDAAMDAAERGLLLADDTVGPWSQAIMHTMAAQLAMQLGRIGEAAVHAHAALPVLDRLGARDDAIQLRSLLALVMISQGDVDAAADQLSDLGDPTESEGDVLAGRLAFDLGRAELALARGDIEAGLAGYHAAGLRVRELQIPAIAPTGLEPWVLVAEATSLAAHAYYAPADDPVGAALFARAGEQALQVLDPEHPYLDYPVCGLVLFALGAWGLLRSALPVADAVRLIALADRFAYNRSMPTLAWERIAGHAEQRAPGLLAAMAAEYGDRRGPDLLDEARSLVQRIGAG
ncbi:AfsR/SARP family transcriptional regulator [Catellatospora citrea]|uniref:SARP family transcriptional regulator n=1 Tax=Catellatospora citrea TaxID=53366 RepID=A0A8J3KAF9_9ACTN|nr:BTAD domain-containing putative transcriptional regulator [Catellatospora citrea]RKE05733.1 putative ATPase [Catellatospora citrea]GIF97094.1 SARP family transcriptional regulator [Catellatospora citrea]